MIIFAVSGWKTSGKDMVAEYLCREHGFQRVSFANPLKDSVAEQFGIPRESLDNTNLKERPILSMPVSPKDRFSLTLARFLVREFRNEKGEPPNITVADTSGLIWESVEELNGPLYWTPRALAILEGSSKRSTDPDYWVKQAVQSMKLGEALGQDRFVISDLRYVNELNALNRAVPNSVIAVRIDRWEDSPSQDPSERDLDSYPFPFRINNKGATQNRVFEQVDGILREKGVICEKAGNQS